MNDEIILVQDSKPAIEYMKQYIKARKLKNLQPLQNPIRFEFVPYTSYEIPSVPIIDMEQKEMYPILPRPSLEFSPISRRHSSEDLFNIDYTSSPSDLWKQLMFSPDDNLLSLSPVSLLSPKTPMSLKEKKKKRSQQRARSRTR